MKRIKTQVVIFLLGIGYITTSKAQVIVSEKDQIGIGTETIQNHYKNLNFSPLVKKQDKKSRNTETKKQSFPINISVMHESTSVPFITSPIKYKYNPAILVGTEYLLKKKNKHDFHLSGNLGYYYHKNWESTLFSEIRIGYRYFIGRFSISTDIGLGYAHLFSLKPTYGFENGKFQEIKNYGRPTIQSSVSITPSYKLSKKINAAEIYLSYISVIQTSASATGGFHQFIGAGYKFYPFKNNN